MEVCVLQCALCWQIVLEMGGLQPGGLNFDAKVRRESTETEDMFIAHIGQYQSNTNTCVFI